MQYAVTILFSYLLGSSSMSFYLSKYKKVDIREKGSKNLGASNAMLVMGWKYGILVGLHDILKAVIAVLLANHFLPQLPYVGAVAGVSCILGHIFPFYLKFKGGKGFASYIGMTLALNWKLALVIILLVILVTLITDYIVLGTTLTITSVPVYFGITSQSFILPAILCIATLVIIYKHRMNYIRILNGTEIGLRSGHKGEHRA